MDGGDRSESGAWRKDCGESHSSTCPHPSVPFFFFFFNILCAGSLQTCAHRYQRRIFANTLQESRDIIGRCYVLSQDLTIDASSDEDGGNWNFCEGRARGHEMFGSCQQGLAATFTKDYHYLVFGAPGAYNWKGTTAVAQYSSAWVKSTLNLV